eukprot:4355979-Amphidinium_carterae.1
MVPRVFSSWPLPPPTSRTSPAPCTVRAATFGSRTFQHSNWLMVGLLAFSQDCLVFSCIAATRRLARELAD